jgi:hypothetical protein
VKGQEGGGVVKRTRMSAGFVLSAVLVASLFPGLAHGQPNLVSNGDFETNVAGWTYEGAPELELSWDGSLGSPAPGSLRLSKDGPASGTGSGEAWSPCFEPPPGRPFELRAKTYAEGSVLCRAYLTRFSGPGCTGSREFIGFPGTVLPDEQGVWLERLDLKSSSLSRPSFRVALFAGLGSADAVESCNFDSVVLVDQTAAVPTTSELGLVVLALALALLGLWSVRIR